MIAYFETVIVNPDTSLKRKSLKILLEGNWDGEKFTHVDERGLETIVRKKDWILFDKPDGYE